MIDREQLTELARKAMGESVCLPEREQGYTFHHGLRTARIALDLHARLDAPDGAEADLTFAGALFHDIGKGLRPHHEIGAAMTVELLGPHLSAGTVEQVARVVREHNQRQRPAECLPESRIVQDADILDHVGAVLIWQAFHYSAVRHETPAHAVAYYFGPEHQQWLDGLSLSLNFELSRDLLAERRVFTHAFYERFAREIGRSG